MAKAICSIEGCETPIFGRGWCLKHYARWRRWGDPTYVTRPPRRDPVCTVDGCERSHDALGLCDMHVQRWRAHGDPLLVKSKSQPGHLNPGWTGDQATYSAVHQRVRRDRGSASKHECPCGRKAQDWAYDHRDPDQRIDPDRGPYSLLAAHYVSLCRSCHKVLDLAHGRAWAHDQITDGPPEL